MTGAVGEKSAKRGFAWGKAVQTVISLALIAVIFGLAVPRFASYSAPWGNIGIATALGLAPHK